MNNRVINDIEFIKKSFVIKLQMDFDIQSLIEIIDANPNKNILIRLQDEVPRYSNINFLKLIDAVSELEHKDVRFTLSTTKQFKYFLHPLTNICLYANTYIRSGIAEKDLKSVYRFDLNVVHLDKIVDTNIKTIKGIISSRKQAGYRDKIFSQINNFDGICRYIKYDASGIDIVNDNTPHPSWEDLNDEYSKSLVAFILETELGPLNDLRFYMPAFSEKTLLSFLHFNIPIIYGMPDLISDLEELGFWIANNDFGYASGDLHITQTHKQDLYLKCIDKYNSMSYMDVKNYYLANLDKIQNNYNIISNLLHLGQGVIKQ